MQIKQLDVRQIGIQNPQQTMSLKLESSRFVNKETIALEVIWLFKNAIDTRRKNLCETFFLKSRYLLSIVVAPQRSRKKQRMTMDENGLDFS